MSSAKNARGLFWQDWDATCKERMGELFHVKYLNILVQHTMNTCVTNNAIHLLKGLDTCSSLIHPIISNSLQTIKVGIWKEQRYGQ